MQLNLIDHKELKDFPSGSGIEYFDNNVYIVGDDAASILVTNKRWKPSHEIKLFENSNRLTAFRVEAADNTLFAGDHK